MCSATTSDRPSWGDESVYLTFGGMHYRIEGLTNRQCQMILRRFQLIANETTPPETSIVIRAARLSFPEPDAMRYADPYCGYSPIITENEKGLSLEGLDFRGEITLQPGVGGVLCTNTEDELGDPMVFENYLRVVTAYAVLRAGGLLLHSAGIARDEHAWMFIGPSGAGKSTISRAALSSGAQILSDDGNLIMPDGQGGFMAGPVPFAGDLGQVPCTDQQSRPVAGIFCLHQSSTVALHPLSGAMAYSRIMACSPTVNVSPSQGGRLDEVLCQLLAAVPVWQLDFTREDGFDEVYRHIRQRVSVQ